MRLSEGLVYQVIPNKHFLSLGSFPQGSVWETGPKTSLLLEFGTFSHLSREAGHGLFSSASPQSILSLLLCGLSCLPLAP